MGNGVVPNIRLQAENIFKSFTSGQCKKQVLLGCSIAVSEGEFFCIVGKSGCGKTTLLRILGSFEKADSGTVYLNQQKTEKPDVKRLMIFQDFNQLFPWKTIIM